MHSHRYLDSEILSWGDKTREENFQRPSGFDFRIQSIFTSRARNPRGRYRERRKRRCEQTSARTKAASGVCPRDFVREQNQDSFRKRRKSVQDVFGDFEHVQEKFKVDFAGVRRSRAVV